MSSSRIELIRGYMEEIENLKKAIVLCMHESARNVSSWPSHQPKSQVMNDHKIKALIEQVQSRSMDVFLLIKDKSG